MIELQLVKDSEKELLYNIFQKYLYEMTKYYDDEMDDKGNYLYRYFDNYFVEPTRKALFIIRDSKIVGFMMLNNHSYVNQKPDHVISEFSIFPMYRKKGIAQEAIALAYSQYPGKWELKFSLKNKSAVNFWRKSTESFKPIVYNLEDDEQVLVFQTNR
ncbi:GNAT family N-acetyltransferase [Clostridium baratii]|uniref:GNAT family N-acetyltransferase n=1 Tax=Clostridium baratii TaxID=1561 RepID=UPI001C24789F|nr:GNAT family N-acetyltransferase [Clostridium baratii]STB00146.1 acetyltransferase [Clostridium baratii]